jgi:hypothetical protein
MRLILSSHPVPSRQVTNQLAHWLHWHYGAYSLLDLHFKRRRGLARCTVKLSYFVVSLAAGGRLNSKRRNKTAIVIRISARAKLRAQLMIRTDGSREKCPLLLSNTRVCTLRNGESHWSSLLPVRLSQRPGLNPWASAPQRLSAKCMLYADKPTMDSTGAPPLTPRGICFPSTISGSPAGTIRGSLPGTGQTNRSDSFTQALCRTCYTERHDW